jgi:Lrp/AsnC family transcriptional regulator
METLDALDRKLLTELQRYAAQSLDHLGETVGLSRNACWRRIKALEASGVLTHRVALVNPNAVGLGLMVFMQIRTGSHDPDWQADFNRAAHAIP